MSSSLHGCVCGEKDEEKLCLWLCMLDHAYSHQTEAAATHSSMGHSWPSAQLCKFYEYLEGFSSMLRVRFDSSDMKKVVTGLVMV